MNQKSIFFIFILIFGIFIPILSIRAISSGNIIINEIQIGQKNDADKEFIELFNQTDYDITLDGFELKKRTAAGTESVLISKSKFKGVIPARGFFLIVSHKLASSSSDIIYDLLFSGSSYYIAANNTILLYNASGTIIDKVGYGTAIDCETAPTVTPEADRSIARKNLDNYSFQDTDNNMEDFFITEIPTPENSKTPRNFVLLPNTSFSETEENVSLNVVPTINTTTTSTFENLNNGRSVLMIAENIYDYSEDIFISEIFPNPKGSDQKASGTGEFIELYNRGSRDVNLNGWSIINKNKKYIFENLEENGLIRNPIIASSSYLVIYASSVKMTLINSGDTIKLLRPLEENAFQSVKYTTAKEELSYAEKDGKWYWTMIITPGMENIIKTRNHVPQVDFSFPEEIFALEPIVFDSSDTQDEDGDTLYFKWDFGDGKKSDQEFPEHIFLKPGKYKVRLSVNDGRTEKTKEKTVKVLAKDNEESELPVLVLKNSSKIIKTKKISTSSKNKTIVKKTSKTKTSASKTSVKTKKIIIPIKTTLDQIRQLSLGTLVYVTGKVAVGPGILGSQYFYIVGSPGIQIYNYKKDFPTLNIGDYIEVRGELKENNGELRLKTISKNDIKFLKKENPPQALILTIEDLTTEHEGQLVKIIGEVTGRKGQSVYIDDGTAEIEAYIRKETGIKSILLKTGKHLELSGIVRLSGGKIRIMPRGEEDINIIEESKGEVLGETAVSDEWTIPARVVNQEKIWQYLLIISLGVILILIGSLIKILAKK